MSMLRVAQVTVRHGSFTALDNVCFSVEEGQWLMVAGPNGAGKSTLVHAIARGVAYQGEIQYRGHNIRRMKPAALAREIGVLSQSYQVGYAFTVEEVVNLGRYAYQNARLSFADAEGAEKVRLALEMTGMLHLREQSVLALSGGELQRVFLAQVFAQDPNLLILDEPTNHLDLKYQKEIFEMIRAWVARPGKAAISVVHDLSLARAYGTHALLLHRGRQEAFGTNREVLSREQLQGVYAMDVQGWMQRLLAQWEDQY